MKKRYPIVPNQCLDLRHPSYDENWLPPETLVLDNTPYVKPGAVSTVAGTKSAAIRLVGGRSWEVWHALVVIAFGLAYLGEPL